MAAEYLRHQASRSGLSHLVIDSAGLLGIEGEPASRESIQLLREAGCDLAGHRSRGVTVADVTTSDLVLCMGLEHLDDLQRRFPAGDGRRYLLRAFEKRPEPQGGAPELDDPIGKDLEFYRQTFEIIRTCVDHLMIYLRHET
jgi:protein-tyrosine phosphatase